MNKVSTLGLVGLSTMLLTDGARAEGVTIDHKPVGCIVAGRFPRLEARIEPADQVARARVDFHAAGDPRWYFVDMKPEAGSFLGVLPQPLKSAQTIHYYIEVAGKDGAEGRTREYSPTVAGAGECNTRSVLVAGVLAIAKVTVGTSAAGAPLVPVGFSAVGVVATGSAAGATGAAGGAATGGGGHAALILAGVAVVGGGVTAAVLHHGSTSLPPPQPTIAIDGQGIVGITPVTFKANGGSGANYSWDFGDGSAGSGQTVTHVYAAEGVFAVTLSTSGATVVSNAVVRSLSGTWVRIPENTSGVSHILAVAQRGGSIGGTWVERLAAGNPFGPPGDYPFPLTGSVGPPRAVRLQENGNCNRLVVGTASPDLNTIVGDVTANANCAVTGTYTLVRR